MTWRVYWGLSILLLSGGVAGFFLSRAGDLGRSPDLSTAELLRLRDAEDTELLGAYEEVINRILLDSGRTTLTQDRSQQLRLAGRFLVGFAQRYGDDRRSTRPLPLIVALRQLGLVNLLLRDYACSEDAIREALRVTDAFAANDPRTDVRTLHALNEGSLGWILAMTGRLHEAERLVESSVQKWEDLIQTLPHQASLSADLAVSRRNLAMIRDVGGGDGLEDAMASVDAATAALAKSGREEHFLRYRCYETLIDSEQFLGMAFWQRGRLAESEQACRASIDHLQQLLETIESLFEANQNQLIPRSKKYWASLATAQQNLDLVNHDDTDQLRVAIDIEAAETDTDEDLWEWILLKNLPGQVLPMDLVIRGNRFPGEFEPQGALLLSWQEEWIFDTLTSIVSAVHGALPVVVLVDDTAQQFSAERQLKRAGIPLDRIQFKQAITDTPWIRDYGPLCVQSASGRPLWVDPAFTYSSSAERFEDDALPRVLAGSYGVSTVDIPVHLQGGAMLSNGAGVVLVSTDLLHRNRRMGVGDEQLNGAVRQYFGAEQVVFLDPLIGESTGHVDWFCAFTSPDTIVVGEYGPDDPVNRDLLNRHAQDLAQLDVPGGKLNVVRIPMPPRARDYFGGSYTNVIFANGVLVVPTWPEASADVEQQVLDQYRRLLPGWTIVPVPSQRLGRRGGGPRCCSMNLLLQHPRRDVLSRHNPGT